ncbi:Xaa-Pro aminopeptidase [Anaerobranca californiensis DSM 14826]|uniref:Xaa-Pro aminopeptidase n=1 Tax=Anaerobranca californiensis DSM 14826 TaxID=1120989 RepID=A0A1M6L876_9FIRM|nr:Xaa-Pro peptidase family protein [Anaerobranca californiensis]SHJ67393.1 Xaa-Pro aminopeptidase [Anaerobranca californiensis DSM 14826]
MERIKKLKGKLKEIGVDGLLITQPQNRYYLSSFTGSSGYLLITEGEDVFLTDFRYTEQANKEIISGITILQHGLNPLEDVLKEIKRLGVKVLGFEREYVTYSGYLGYKKAFEGIELKAVEPVVEELRMVKDQEEIANMEKAIEIAGDAFAHILGFLKPGITEKDVALELEFFMKRKGASGLAFTTIVASGYRSSLPHGVALDKVLEKGDFVKIDFGCIFNNYCSDLTRTVVLGKATDEQKKIYYTVLEAQEAALAGIKSGISGKDADWLAREIIYNKGYTENFGHGLGHGIGMVVHENPRLSPKAEDSLQVGNVVTVEPGIYIPNFGGVRIEDMVVITENGNRNLTKVTKELIEIN